jgi:tRNA (cmo5U34)-methyltransferase
MNNFDSKAREWDKDLAHMDRSIAIAAELKRMIPINPSMTALEYGAGTGILSFLLKDNFAEITLLDSSSEMIRVSEEKIEYYQAKHIRALVLDLMHSDFNDKFDVIYTQMVLHHVTDIELILDKFFTMLNPGGYLAIADLFTEDGSFHGPEVLVHKGFEPEELRVSLEAKGFVQTDYKQCYEIRRESGKTYPIFLLCAKK